MTKLFVIALIQIIEYTFPAHPPGNYTVYVETPEDPMPINIQVKNGLICIGDLNSDGIVAIDDLGLFYLCDYYRLSAEGEYSLYPDADVCCTCADYDGWAQHALDPALPNEWLVDHDDMNLMVLHIQNGQVPWDEMFHEQ